VSLPWGTYGRWCLVVLLTALTVLNSASTAGGRYVTPVTVTALLCGLALLVRRLPWYASAAPATAATGLWGWPLLPLLLVALFDLAARRRARVAVGCAAAALGANLLIPPGDLVVDPAAVRIHPVRAAGPGGRAVGGQPPPAAEGAGRPGRASADRAGVA
jgi:hypothetical protein